MSTLRFKCSQCQALAINGHATHETGCHSSPMVYTSRGRETVLGVWKGWHRCLI